VLTALDDAAMQGAFPVRCAAFHHDVVDRPELTLAALAALVDRVPATWVSAHRAQRDPREGRGVAPLLTGGSFADVVRDIADADASVRIHHTERTIEWSDLAAGIERAVREFVGDREGGVDSVNLGVFVASPRSVTPAHPDRHHNLLLQIAGSKAIWLEDDADTRRRHVRVLDYFEKPNAGVTELPPARTLEMTVGDAVYIPPYAFHWTEVLDRPSVALSVGFSTRASIASAEICDFDRRLRRRGLRSRPTPPFSLSGRAKAALERAARDRSARTRASRVTVAEFPDAEPGAQS
jgi:hypothetical protein